MGTQGADSRFMLWFAAQAFQVKNFQLACEIYDRHVKEQESGDVDWEVLLRRADCLACAGRLQDACDLYQRAAAHRKVTADQLELLVSCLAKDVRSREGLPRPPTHRWGMLSCRECQGILYEPVTRTCGHTFCKKCLETCVATECAICKEIECPEDPIQHHRVNVLLSNIICKRFPMEVQAESLRQKAGDLIKESRLEEALAKCNEAIELVSSNHLLYGDRSMIHTSLKSHECALQDAETACQLQAYWLTNHMRKAHALVNMGKHEEALKEYLLCVAIDTDNKTAKQEAQKLLLSFLCPGNSEGDLSTIQKIVTHPIRSKANLLSPFTTQGACSDIQRLYTQVNWGNKKCLAVSEDKVFTACSPVKKAFQMEFPEVTKGAVCSEDSSLLIPSKANTLKRKHCSDEATEARDADVPCKLMKRDILPADKAYDCISPSIDPSDLDCPLCMRLLYEPITTICGHTYCLKCLERSLDHSPNCPLCKKDLCEYLIQRKFCKTDIIEGLIANYFPDELKDRKTVYEEEMAELSNLNKNVPIFVCTMAFPTVPCPLHIYEPCYRLMIRRCMETGTKQFGMCIGDPVKGFADYGCMLEIRNVDFFLDGRSVVDSIGRRRFKVLQHSQRDGYNTADIEYIEDQKVQGEDYAELLALHDTVYDQACAWFSILKPALKSRILKHFGPMPEKESDIQATPNGPAWCWWMVAVLPLESKAQLPFLAMTSLKDRLTTIKRVLLLLRTRPR
ncbi:LON peptidase N-terminal domain and RING finger protein 3 [Spea bombifrons]|uniref:LON peptidase N-terminal domain and RING finger protein 3 n=1 Tax=Spea bombifrons TaxID=233779 RepID=UPI00234AAFC4|nr:LON peptidase N-terminal domain and RING finger protein 3 [Spea bombifrons]